MNKMKWDPKINEFFMDDRFFVAPEGCIPITDAAIKFYNDNSDHIDLKKVIGKITLPKLRALLAQ